MYEYRLGVSERRVEHIRTDKSPDAQCRGSFIFDEVGISHFFDFFFMLQSESNQLSEVSMLVLSVALKSVRLVLLSHLH